MSPAVDTPTLALVCYPGLWNASCEIHPRTSPDYSWQDHLRCLCRLARALHEAQPAELRFAGDAERMHIEALATVPAELLILDVERDRLSRPHLPSYELWWLDPTDEHLRSRVARPQVVGRPLPGTHI
jgi:hypothetical protein